MVTVRVASEDWKAVNMDQTVTFSIMTMYQLLTAALVTILALTETGAPLIMRIHR
jgi:hypothetical protein